MTDSTLRCALSMALALAMAGCVTVYQPLSGLNRPVALDPGLANFADTSIALRCVPGGALTEGEADTLCRKVSQLFENQGARVTIESVGRIDDAIEAAEATEATEAAGASALRVELRAEVVHRDAHSVLFGPLADWIWGYTADYTVRQEVRIKGADGFLLAQETLTGRFVQRLGFFSDADEDFSRDYYGRLSQLALDARVRQTVLAEAGGGSG